MASTRAVHAGATNAGSNFEATNITVVASALLVRSKTRTASATVVNQSTISLHP